MVVADDTDLEAAAKFDLSDFLKDSGLEQSLGINSSTPELVAKRNLKRAYVVPEAKQRDSKGGVELPMNYDIVAQNFTSMLKGLQAGALSANLESRRRL